MSGKVHATIPKGIGGGFEGTVVQRYLKECKQEAMDICLRVLKESNKSRFDSFSSYEQCIDHIPYYLSGLSRAHFFRRPFSKQLYTLLTRGGNLKIQAVLNKRWQTFLFLILLFLQNKCVFWTPEKLELRDWSKSMGGAGVGRRIWICD